MLSDFFLFFCVISGALSSNVSVKNLMGEPDYRKVKLHWETDIDGIPQSGYQVRFCELQTWGVQRCRNHKVVEQEDNNLNKESNFKLFDVEIGGLRMATKYSFEVRAQKENGSREDRADGDNSENILVIPTKGFSARATQCLPHASVIEVSTGPYFRGRIAVEAADGERCALDGEPNSPRDIYTLKIDHEKCGSQVNETTVGTFVLVQENLPILTHSTRRFLVLCSFQPETLTVRAGISLPTNALGRGQYDAVAFEESDNYMRRSRHLRPARLLQGPDALDKKNDEVKQEVHASGKSVPIALLAVLMVLGIVGLVCVAVRCSTKRISKEMDNVSISSESSTASCTTNADVEADAAGGKESTLHGIHHV